MTRGLALAMMAALACGGPARPATKPTTATTTATTTAAKPKPKPRPRPRPTPATPPAATPPPAVAPVAPATAAATSIQRGQAVYYGSGKRTASGERFDKRAMTAAHRTLPFGTWVRVTVEKTGASVVVRINDRGPFGNPKRIIDVTEGAARKLGIIDAGVAAVTVEVLPGAP